MTTEGSASRRQIYGDPSLVNEVLRLTPCSCAIFPTSERKGRAKQLFIALRPMAFELYKQRTDVEKKKTPKHLIEFDHLFNISLQKEPNHFKGDVLVLMTPKTTYYIEPNDTEATVKDWFELTFERVREARSDRVLRPVFKEDFFEAAWDVVAIKKPKLKREVKREKMHDLVEATANLQGRRRLCVTPTSYMLFKMEVLANASPETDQYYEKSSFYEFPINVISNYGKQEKYFFLRLGRYSDLGGGEIWLNCDSGDTAKEVHDTICRLSEREAEKRRLNGVVLPLVVYDKIPTKTTPKTTKSNPKYPIQFISIPFLLKLTK
uniref:IRS-type PTB domain-containing protein n=1 Tax=Panagrellus redivivus TaxID=6233 RepID=A0A7E4VS91_PANRE